MNSIGGVEKNKVTFGERLRNHRESHGVTLEAVAEELRITASVLSRKERDKPDVAPLTRPEFLRACAKVDEEYAARTARDDPADVLP